MVGAERLLGVEVGVAVAPPALCQTQPMCETIKSTNSVGSQMIHSQRKHGQTVCSLLLTKSQHGMIDHFQQSQNIVTEALQTFGG